jgi:hypothetical protein
LRQEPITLRAVQGYPWPWPYAKLDPEDIRKRGHKFYYEGGCGYGAFNALISALAEKVGEPFTLMPPQMRCTDALYKASSPERAERCARLTGDTVARAVELLNDSKDGRFRATYAPPSEVSSCLSCHDTAYGHVLSSTKMDCRQCHDDSFDHLW